MCPKHYARWRANGHPGKSNRWAQPLDGTDQKYCTLCDSVKPRTEFRPEPRRRDGYYPHCRPCASKASKAIRQNNIERYRERERLTYLSKKFNITHDEVRAIFRNSNGLCEICGGPPNGRGGLHVDHCHTTGKIRGLLCNSCNVSIGHFRDDPAILRRAADYLEFHQQPPLAA
ncbi:endonuclease VII domain-containing protein [Nocardia sp. NPDC057455]|uniref:endonuclease VII domain-containing protein n=1 Tax=Nocardia sp. NPDC057455 TaxID=3346138 RepID=UPI00366AECD8